MRADEKVERPSVRRGSGVGEQGAAAAAVAAAAAESDALRGRMRELEGALKQAMRDYKSLVAAGPFNVFSFSFTSVKT